MTISNNDKHNIAITAYFKFLKETLPGFKNYQSWAGGYVSYHDMTNKYWILIINDERSLSSGKLAYPISKLKNTEADFIISKSGNLFYKADKNKLQNLLKDDHPKDNNFHTISIKKLKDLNIIEIFDINTNKKIWPANSLF
jgi:hypothetical protein